MPKEEPTQAGEDLATLAAVPRYVEVYTIDEAAKDARVPKRVRVAPMTFKVCAQVSESLKRIAKDWTLANIYEEDIPVLIADHADSLLAIVAATTKEPPDYLDELPADQFALLALNVWEVNHDFFARRVVPILKKMGGAKLLVGDGPTQSDSSTSTESANP